MLSRIGDISKTYSPEIGNRHLFLFNLMFLQQKGLQFQFHPRFQMQMTQILHPSEMAILIHKHHYCHCEASQNLDSELLLFRIPIYQNS